MLWLRLSLALAAPALCLDLEPYAQGVRATTEDPTVRSEMGPVESPLSLELADFLLDFPDLTAHLVHLHRIAPYKITMLGPRVSTADDGAGARGTIVLLEREDQRRTYFADGTYDRRFLPAIQATAFIEMTIHETPPGGCPPLVASDFQVYVRLKNRFAAALLTVLRPFVAKTVARVFARAFLTADKVGRLMASDPEVVTRETLAFPRLSAADRERFLAIVERFKARRSSAGCPK